MFCTLLSEACLMFRNHTEFNHQKVTKMALSHMSNRLQIITNFLKEMFLHVHAPLNLILWWPTIFEGTYSELTQLLSLPCLP